MKTKTYLILSECIATGIEIGWHRAHKHTDKPTYSQIADAIDSAIMGQINDYFTFDEEVKE